MDLVTRVTRLFEFTKAIVTKVRERASTLARTVAELLSLLSVCWADFLLPFLSAIHLCITRPPFRLQVILPNLRAHFLYIYMMW